MTGVDDLKNGRRILARKLYGSKHPVFFTRAGISTESGLPDSRGPDRLRTRRNKGLTG